MTVRVGINGFGRIGRQCFKAMLDYYPDDIEIGAGALLAQISKNSAAQLLCATISDNQKNPRLEKVVEEHYESMAILGSIPNIPAVSAELMAISASCSEFGLGFTAQSPYASTLSARHMRNTLETIEQSGLVLMISKLGRIV